MTNIRRIYLLLSVVIVLSMLAVSACAKTATPAPTTTTETEIGPTSEVEDTEVVPTDEPPPPEDLTMTEFGTPRSETLIIDQVAVSSSPDNFNPYSAVITGVFQGTIQFNLSALWEIDTKTGTQFPAMAAEPLKAIDDTYTKWQIKLREGLYWSDGVEITAEDVAFTYHMILSNPTLPASAQLALLLKDNAKVVDKYTLEVETVGPRPRLQQSLGVFLVFTQFQILPKHIWENVDPMTFENNPPVGSGPYILKEYDPNGSWYLWERREDWERTDVGMIEGMPKPKYILFISYGTEEKRLLAAIDNKLDVLFDISPESWAILHDKNPYAQAWYDNFPWADFDDPCERGVALNLTIPPYDQNEVRWALALATDIVSVSLATYDGMLRVSPLGVAPIEVIQKTYHFPMEQWLKDFTLPDGYHPFDPDFAINIATKLREAGIEGLPEEVQELKEIFGVGWWKYDPEEATKLLESVGFSMDSSGKWLLPDGTPWKINITGPANFEAESERLTYAVAESWKKFGIDAVVNPMDANTYAAAYYAGNFEAASATMLCAVAPDAYSQLSIWHTKNLLPIGEFSMGNTVRANSPEISALLDQLEVLSPDDPQTIELTKEILKQMVADVTMLPMFGTSKFVPVTTYWWDGFPTANNFYNGPWNWWMCYKFVVPHLEPTGNK